MFKLSLHSLNDDHLIIDITPDEHFKNNQPSTNHVLTQIIKDRFTFLYGQKHKDKPVIQLLVNSRTITDLVYDVDESLSKYLDSFIDNLIPEISRVTFYNGDKTKTYRYLGEKDNIITFKQIKYNNSYDVIIKIPILK